MQPINTLSELRLLKENLKTQLRYQKEKIKEQSGTVVSDYKSFAYGMMLEKGFLILLRFFQNKGARKNTARK